MSLEEAVSLALRYTSEESRNTLLKLLGKLEQGSNLPVFLTVDDIIADFFGLNLRLEKLGRLLDHDRRFLQPERPLVYFSLDGPYVKWGKRNYNGNPLAYFRRHADVYGRFVTEGRAALFDFDSAIYNALRTHKANKNGSFVRQIELAIPGVKPCGRPEIKQSEIDLIVGAYPHFDGVATRAAYDLTYSRATITRHWRRAGLKVDSSRKSKISEIERQQIIEAHSLYGGSAYQASRNLPFSSNTILKYWRHAGLQVLKRNRTIMEKYEARQLISSK